MKLDIRQFLAIALAVLLAFVPLSGAVAAPIESALTVASIPQHDMTVMMDMQHDQACESCPKDCCAGKHSCGGAVCSANGCAHSVAAVIGQVSSPLIQTVSLAVSLQQFDLRSHTPDSLFRPPRV